MYRRRVITQAQLEKQVMQINLAAGSPTTPYVNGVAQIGNYHLSYAYGGVSLHRMLSERGAIEDVFRCGHVPKRDLFNMMAVFTPPQHKPETTKEN